jgi:hypothetical protein
MNYIFLTDMNVYIHTKMKISLTTFSSDVGSESNFQSVPFYIILYSIETPIVTNSN